MKIVIANSVGVDSEGYRMLHYPSRWTTGVKRAPFTWYPWELAYLCALLKRDTEHQVNMFDGCLEGLTAAPYTEKIVSEKPDVLVMESATRTFVEDMRVAREVKRRCGSEIILTGQHATAFPEQASQVADYVCLGEYEPTVLEILRGTARDQIAGLYPNQLREPFDIDMLPWPEDSDIRRIDYCYPCPPGLKYRQIQAYGSRGCPYRCVFCVCSHLYYSKPNWRARNTDDIVNEIIYLKDRYSEMEGIFFDDEVHNLKRDFVIELADKIVAAKLSPLHFTGMCTYSNMDEEVLEKLFSAGYYQIRVGIETASENVAERIGMRGKLNVDKLTRVLETAKRIGIEMYGTFLIGAPGSDEVEDGKTIALIKDLLRRELLDEMQVSICTPQPGTPFFKQVEQDGSLWTKDWRLYDGCTHAVVGYPGYSTEQIIKSYRIAEDIGHYYRGRISLKKEGVLPTLNKALRKRGVWGSLKLVGKHLAGKI